jgi:transposase-like protein
VIGTEKDNLFKWQHYQLNVIVLMVKWFFRYKLSSRDLVKMRADRGLLMAYTTIMGGVH